MKFSSRAPSIWGIVLAAVATLSACDATSENTAGLFYNSPGSTGSTGTPGSGTTTTVSAPPASGTGIPAGIKIASAPNVMAVTVDGSQCNQNNLYPNKPCVSVTVCTPGSTTECQTINDILLDTGSNGLRIFSSIVTVPLTPLEVSGKAIGECETFGIGADWGSIKYADVVLGSERAPSVPIQVIDSTFSGFQSNPSWCNDGEVDLSPSEAGYNGILGVGLLVTDCGLDCDPSENYPQNGMFFSCTGTTCTGTTLPIAEQVPDPVSMLAKDNNGVILSLPSMNGTSANSLTGALILGIGTESNNTLTSPSSVTTFHADATYGQFYTSLNGKADGLALIDSGTNAFNLPTSNITSCSNGFLCPASETQLSATQIDVNGSSSKSISFPIVNASEISDDYNGPMVLGGLGSVSPPDLPLFIWGLPFFYGRTITVGFWKSWKTPSPPASNLVANLPYWAY